MAEPDCGAELYAALTVGGGSGGVGLAQLDLVIGESVPLTGGLATMGPAGGS